MTRFARRSPATVVWSAVVVGFLSLAVAASRAAEGVPDAPLDNPASASPCLKFMPQDVWVVGEVNWKALMSFANSPELVKNPQRAQFDQAMLMIRLMTGINAEKEVERIAFFVTMDQGTDAGGAIVIQGTFNELLVELRLKAAAEDRLETETYNDYDLYSADDIAFCLPGNSIILVGDKATVKRALDRLDDEDAALSEAMQNVLDRTPAEAIAWAALRPQEILAHPDFVDWRKQHAALSRNLRKLESLSLALTASDEGLYVDALGYVADSDYAGEVYEFLRDEKRDLLHTEGVNVVLASFLVLSEVDQSSNYVHGSFGLTIPSLTKLWETKFLIKE